MVDILRFVLSNKNQFGIDTLVQEIIQSVVEVLPVVMLAVEQLIYA